MDRKYHRHPMAAGLLCRFMNALVSCYSRMKTLSLLTILAWAHNVLAAQSLPAVPRFDGLGRHHHEITTRWALAQRYFDQGLTLCFNFNHAEAIRSFEAAATVDPECAMAYWGVAFAHGPNINAPMDDSAVPKAWDALQKAIQLKGKASAKEREYIDALAKRYVKEPVKERAPLDRKSVV